MEWFILLVAVPLIVVPIVLLCGFTGCDPFKEDTAQFNAPTELNATAMGTGLIRLAWKSNSPAETAKFGIERSPNFPTTWTSIPDVTAQPDVSNPTTDDNVDEGSHFFYRVSAKTNNGTTSGYSNESSAKTLLVAPASFVATEESPSKIKLTWINKSTKANKIRLERSLKSDFSDFVPLDPPKPVSLQPVSYTDDKNLNEGTTYYYRIASLGDNATTSATVSANATTKVWRTSFDTTLNKDGGNYYKSACLVQRINAARVTEGGTWVRVTMNSMSANETKLLAVYISSPTPGGNQWTSAADLVELKFKGASGASLRNGVPQISEETKFTVAKNKDLIIAFATSTNSQNLFYADVTGPKVFAQLDLDAAAAVARTADPNRNLGQGPDNDKVICVERIEVA